MKKRNEVPVFGCKGNCGISHGRTKPVKPEVKEVIEEDVKETDIDLADVFLTSE